jgi:hypothetical protein
LTHLGEKLNVLHLQMPEDRTKSQSQQEANSSVDPKLEDVIKRRQTDGYTLVRHRTVIGEQMAAMIRGRLTPTFVVHPLREKFKMQSNFGSDLQILDPDLSLMDISYTSAWQLGKTLATGDSAFAASLARLQNAIDSTSLAAAKKDVHAVMDLYRSRGNTARNMLGLVQGLNNPNHKLHERGSLTTATVGDNRWNYDGENNVEMSDMVDTSRFSPHITARIAAHA